VILADESLHVHRTPTHLLPVNPADQRFVARIFLVHPASLLLFVQFSRRNLDGFLHSFKPQRVGHPRWLSRDEVQTGTVRTALSQKINGCATRLYNSLSGTKGEFLKHN
jgi:hypothetical protein